MRRSDVPTRYNAVDILERNLAARAEKVALVSPGRELTFAEVMESRAIRGLCVEPNPRLHPLSECHLAMNKLDNVNLIKGAVAGHVFDIIEGWKSVLDQECLDVVIGCSGFHISH